MKKNNSTGHRVKVLDKGKVKKKKVPHHKHKDCGGGGGCWALDVDLTIIKTQVGERTSKTRAEADVAKGKNKYKSRLGTLIWDLNVPWRNNKHLVSGTRTISTHDLDNGMPFKKYLWWFVCKKRWLDSRQTFSRFWNYLFANTVVISEENYPSDEQW